MAGPAMASPAGIESTQKSGPSVVMLIVDTICFLAAAGFAALLYIEFSKTL